MKIAIIPARGGSKRIPRKNIKEFCGKPMIAYSIEAAIKSGCFDRVIVSTDDTEIAEVAKTYGAEIPFIRPDYLADDYTATNDVIVHAIEFFQAQGINIELVSCIYATAPFITPISISESVKLIEENDSVDYAVTVTEFAFPIQRALKISNQGQLSLREPEYAMTRSQDLDLFYHDAGQVYTGRPSSFTKVSTVFKGSILPVILSPKNVQDIDTPDDWDRAEVLFKILGY